MAIVGNKVRDDRWDRRSNSKSSTDDKQRSAAVEETTSLLQRPVKEARQSQWRAYFTVGILALINLLNYMDRFTIPGVLPQVSDSYKLTQTESGLLQTVFICSYMVFAPLFGFLGDQYNRKWLIVVGVTIWSIVTLASSFVPDDKYWLFVFTRALVGIGECSYITVSPSIVGDLFGGERRVTMLTCIYLTVPVGSGLGFLAGAQLAAAFGDWRYALRFTPMVAVVCIILLIVFVREPERGYADRQEQARIATSTGQTSELHSRTSSYTNGLRQTPTLEKKSMCSSVWLAFVSWAHDVWAILRIPTFVLNAVGYTAVTFVTGALSWWGPTYFSYAFVLPTARNVFATSLADVSFVMGLLTCVAGVLSVSGGLLAARLLRPRIGMRADPYTCAGGMLLAGPAVYLLLIVSPFSDLAAYILVFISELGLCINWALTTDITLRVVGPSRRSSANAFSMLFCHLFGDALCPLLLGIIADTLVLQMCGTAGLSCSLEDSSTIPVSISVLALMYALFCNAFVSIIGAGAYLFCALTLERDAKHMENMLVSTLHQSEALSPAL